jgi:ribosomal protein L37AE/L43A
MNLTDESRQTITDAANRTLRELCDGKTTLLTTQCPACRKPSVPIRLLHAHVTACDHCGAAVNVPDVKLVLEAD